MATEGTKQAAVLVLGLGNRLLGDDASGLELTALLRELFEDDPRVEFVDGGTQGLALLGRLDGLRALLVLDAFAGGDPPGTVRCIEEPLEAARARPAVAHGSSASELLAAASLLGRLPAEVALVGIEPATLRTRVGLSPRVRDALPLALEVAAARLERMLAPCAAEAPCTS